MNLFLGLLVLRGVRRDFLDISIMSP